MIAYSYYRVDVGFGSPEAGNPTIDRSKRMLGLNEPSASARLFDRDGCIEDSGTA